MHIIGITFDVGWWPKFFRLVHIVGITFGVDWWHKFVF